MWLDMESLWAITLHLNGFVCNMVAFLCSGFPLPQEVCMSHLLMEVSQDSPHLETPVIYITNVQLCKLMSTCLCVDLYTFLYLKDEEDQAYLTDELGNIELAKSPVPMTASADSSSAPRSEKTEDWGEWPDDPAYLEALQEVERATEEVPDELLLQAVTDCE